jgi:hypothetical protein
VWSWLAPAIGLATLVVLAGATIRLPGHAVTASAVVGIALALSVVVLWLSLPSADRALRIGLPVVVLIVLAASLPFAANGGFGVFTGKSNDLGYYLYDAQWLETHAGSKPPHIVMGFPMGPPAVAVVASKLTGGTSLVATFTAFMIAVATAAGLASLALFRSLPPVRRTIGAFLVGLPYMAASFYVQSSFKELAAGLFALAFALWLREVARESEAATALKPLAAVIPLGLLADAGVYTYSFAGLYWPAGILGLWAAMSAVVHRDRLREWARGRRFRPTTLRRVSVPLLVGVVAVLVLTIPSWTQVEDFFTTRGSLNALSGGSVAGDLARSPFFYTALGIWPVTDYRGQPPSMLLERLWFVVALALFLRGMFHLARRRQLAVLAGVGSVGALYLAARWGSGAYVQSKALAILAPTFMLATVYGAFAPGWGSRRDRSGERVRWRIRRIAWIGAALVFCAGALISTYLALGGSLIKSGAQMHQLEALARKAQGSRVLFLGSDDYVGWELRGASVASTDPHSGVFQLPVKRTTAQIWPRYDFDSVRPKLLDSVEYVITARGPFQSQQPPNFERVGETDNFVLWRRVGPTPPRQTLLEGLVPGKVLRCDTPRDHQIAAAGGVAGIWPQRPVYGLPDGWRASTPPPQAGGHGYPTALVEGRSLMQTLELGPGRWAISLQYASARPLELTAPGLDVRIGANSQRLGSLWPVATINVPQRSPVPFKVALAPRSTLQDALAGPDRLNTGLTGLVGAIAATPVGDQVRTVPLRQACGRFVDWYRLR